MNHNYFRRLTTLFLALAITLAGVASAQAADGSLDPTFGNGGKVTTDFGFADDNGNTVVIQPNGKIIVAGYSNNDFALARYNSDGSLDPTFGVGGRVTTDFGNNADRGNTVVLQPDGKIIVAGFSHTVTVFDTDFALARYNPDGSLDTTFGIDGKITTDFGSGRHDYGYAVTIQPDGKIIIVGLSDISTITSDFALARYNTDGSLDTTFDSDGRVITDFNDYDIGTDIVLQTDGKIVVAGYSANSGYYDFALARYNSDGSLDISFDADGKVTTDFGNSGDEGHAVVSQPDGKILVAGTIQDPNSMTFDFGLARYNTDGSLDTTFDSDGRVITDFNDYDIGTDIVLQTDGKIVVAGFSLIGTGNDFALARYNSDGSLDMTFDTDGKVTTDFGSHDYGASVALQPDGKIVMAGTSFNGSENDFALARYDIAASATEVTIDVKPGRFPNRIQLEKHVCKDDDNLYVAILTTPDFDALTVDASSLELGNPQLGKTVSPVRSRARDVDLDGDMDMALTFPLCKMIQRGVLKTSTTELILTGTTIEGIAITGRDSVKVVRED